MEALDAIKPRSIYVPEKVAAENIFPAREKAAKKEEAPQEKPKVDSAKVQKIRQDKTEKVAETIKSYMNSMQTDLKIRVHRETGKIMVKVISKEDGRVVREVPPEELLNLAAKMEDMMGVLFDRKA